MVFALAQPQNTADGLLTLSPVPQTCKSAPVPWNPRPPVIRNPCMLDAAAVVREFALRAVVLVIDGCFPLRAVATFPVPVIVTLAAVTEDTFRAEPVVSVACFSERVVAMSVPLRYSGPVSIMLDPIMAEPATSIDGALTGALNTALPAEIPSRSTLLLSAKLNVPDAGLIRAQVNSLIATIDELVSVACF